MINEVEVWSVDNESTVNMAEYEEMLYVAVCHVTAYTKHGTDWDINSVFIDEEAEQKLLEFLLKRQEKRVNK